MKTEINGIQIVQDIEDVVKELSNGNQVVRFEFGDSMKPIFNSGEYAVLTPINDVSEIEIGDAVFCKVNEHWMTHMVWIKNKDTNQCLIGSTSGDLYGWTDIILAKATRTTNRETERERMFVPSFERKRNSKNF